MDPPYARIGNIEPKVPVRHSLTANLIKMAKQPVNNINIILNQ